MRKPKLLPEPLDCSRRNIRDLTGIEAFTALTELICYNNRLTALDVSANTALTTLSAVLFFGCNQLTALDVQCNKSLTL